MKRLLIALTLIATPLVAQQKSTDSGKKPVAVVDGEVITAAKLDWMYDRLPDDIRAQYAQNGGKGALLDNYIRKRLVIHQAEKSGFDKRPDVKAELEAARESTLFDEYVRDVVSKEIVTESAMKQYYEQHLAEFNEPEMVKLRHIVIGITNTGPKPHTDQQALEIAKKAMTDIIVTIPRTDNPALTAQEHATKFAALARAYSEDAVGPSGGDLGWVTRAQLDPELATVAFSIHTGVPSGIIKTKYGYEIVFVEGKRAAGTLSFDEAKPRIRNAMLKEHAADIVAAVNQLTDDLSDKAKIEVHPENIR
jgi:peptidyl-prolyl cis-trans isomerase C